MSDIKRNPLTWPDNVSRTPPHQRMRPRFEERSLSVAADFVLEEINRLNERRYNYDDQNVIISSNLRLKQDGTPYSGQVEPSDTGVAVYFQLNIFRNGKKFERPIVMTCDKWIKTAFNLYAIGKDIKAQRDRDRWGCTNYEQAFRGYVAIPERCGGLPWWEELGVKSTAGRKEIEDAFKAKAKTEHPDKGGTHERWIKIQESFEQAMAQFR